MPGSERQLGRSRSCDASLPTLRICLAGSAAGIGLGKLTATISAPPTLSTVRGDGVRQVVMTLSEYEQRTLDGIETNCRREDPAFADRMNLTAAKRSNRAVLLAHWGDLDRLADADDRRRTGPQTGVHRGPCRLLRARPDRCGSG